MESSIQKAYERVVNDDGTIDLKFDGKRFGQNAAASGFILSLVLLPTSCAVTYPLLHLGKPGGGIFMAWVVAAFAVWFMLCNFIANASHTIKIKPSLGISFDGTQIPFNEIKKIGTTSDGRSAYVYAVSKGTEVRLTKYLAPALAESIVDEIKAGSGTTWS